MQKTNLNISFSNRFSVGLCLSPQRLVQRTKRKGRWRKWRSVSALQLGSVGRIPVCWIGKLVNNSLYLSGIWQSLHRSLHPVETSRMLFSDVTDDFRIFCGDLGNEVNDDILARAFSRYPSFLKAKVPFPVYISLILVFLSKQTAAEYSVQENLCRESCLSPGGERQTDRKDQRLRLRQLQGSKRLRESHERDERSVFPPTTRFASQVCLNVFNSARVLREVRRQSSH